ncbi:PIN domain-containing protein [Xenophilus arseniciresistens]|uniref:Ribonuclease VapC n=1 Tax=Xenophilus arseniciresistens TaxID=1283306 RepID=A0AAE3N7E7_9BURK|nr:PIN domain-containing protein [Xenophilus arseniciresistens]MDA7416965.1 PIN domain-containing protein [Xenophilus arseniciresistens]
MMTADSSVWIDHFRGQLTPAVERLRGALRRDDEVILLDLVLMEVLRGFVRDAEWMAARKALGGLPVLPAGGKAVALRAAELYRSQRRRGITIRSSIDLMVAAWCLETGCPLLQGDRDFDGIEGLQTWMH